MKQENIIEFIKQYGPKLNKILGPSLCQLTDLDVEVLYLLETDCYVTKEVIRRITMAEEKITIKIVNSALDKLSCLLQNHSKYGCAVVYFSRSILTHTDHYMTIINSNNKTYLIQSYLDLYSYHIDEVDYNELYKNICQMYDTDDIKLANDLIGDVQSRQPLVDVDKYITFTFCTCSLADISLENILAKFKHASNGDLLK